jgi:hypothetical protein
MGGVNFFMAGRSEVKDAEQGDKYKLKNFIQSLLTSIVF